MTKALPLLLLLGPACVPLTVALAPSHAADEHALDQAGEVFYAGTRAEDLRAAVQQAKQAGPTTARYHDLAGQLAALDGDEDATFDHLFAALEDTQDPWAVAHLNELTRMEWTWSERARAEALLEQLATLHPDADVRELAAWHLSYLVGLEGNFGARDKWLRQVSGRLDFAVVGTWDNDSGKGYELELAPERKSELTDTYEDRGHTLSWRKDAPVDPRGRLDLAALMYPSRWAVAFAQATYVAPHDGTFRLRVTTSDPIKVWVDRKEVLAMSEVEHSIFDQFQMDLPLNAGPHQVLVKSAHQDDAWTVLVRLTEAQGPLRDVRAQVTGGCEAWGHRADLVHIGLGGRHAVKAADEYLEQCPKSLVARLALNEALWFNQERGRTADLLASLDAEAGDQLAFVRLRQARFHQQQGLRQRARDELLALAAKPHPPREAFDLLAEHYRNEGWNEDELDTLKALNQRYQPSPGSLMDLSKALLRSGRRAEALEVLHDVLDRLPYLGEGLKHVSDLELEAGRLERTEAVLRKRLKSWPTDYASLLELAEVLRREHRPDESKQVLLEAEALAPDNALAHQRAGNLAYEAGQKDAAVQEWRQALELNPDDERLANRLDFVAPEKKGPWAADVPDEATLEAALRARSQLKPLPGADVAYLLDHEVTQLNSDGSTINVVTMVMHAFNPAGRDRLLKQNVAGAGRVRILSAYAVDENGRRAEASSERNRSVLFRGLQPNSTVVLQYRLDSPPTGYLSRYLTKAWGFQGLGDQRVKSQFIFWEPLGTQLHEERVGPVERKEEKRGDQLRITWTATQMPPLVSEPAMPTVAELAANIKISTVPDWTTWLSWERALLDGAFRDSPEVDALAKQLSAGADTPKDKLDRIHQYVMEEIRYQQDYETFIAGVKPHPAPMTLERRYGDCKDKAVLFITLAEKLGVSAHFALVRTRESGPVETDVPMQQFNHAIVYVPEQPGVSARFYDPTADMLDLDVVRPDDVGTQSLVFDPKSGEHQWREIPFQAPALNSEDYQLDLQLDATGGAEGTMKMFARGRSGSGVRRTARNAEYTAQYMQRLASALVPGATASEVQTPEVKRLDAPAELSAAVKSRTLARSEGDTLRMKLPNDWTPHNTFALATRRHPLVFGTPSEYLLTTRLSLPDGYQLKKAPEGGAVDTPCLFFERKVTPAADGRSLTVVQTVRFKCERISAAEYGKYRDQSDVVSRLLEDELVLSPAPKAKAKPSR